MTPVRPLLWVFLVTTFIGMVQLYIRYDSPEIAFAWTIEPPISAAFFGAGYASGFLLTALALREDRWAGARIAVVTVLVFACLTLVVTLVHVDRFHLDSGGLVANAAAWLWLAVYVVVPAMGVVLYLALSVDEEDPPVRRPMGRAMRAALAVVGAAMLVVGLALLLDPTWVANEWPWQLTPLTGRAIAAWLVALGVAAFLAIRERGIDRLRSAYLTFAVFGVLLAIALARYSDQVTWDGAGTWIYLAWLAGLVVIGLAGTVAGSIGRGPSERPG
jgi:hypothetical protein